MIKENDNMRAVGYFVPNPDFIPRGEYKRTELDDEKDAADMLLTGIYGNWYTLWIQNPQVRITGKRVEWHTDKSVSVTESIFKKLDKQYTIEYGL